MRSVARTVALFSVIVLAASTAGAAPAADATPASASTGPSPSLSWHACAEAALKGFQCATLTVLKDPATPAAGTFDLAVVRLKANGTAKQRVGSLFFNPGGPGVSAVDLAGVVAKALPAQLRRAFDFVTWDPRGVGRSSGLADCDGGEYSLPATGAVDWDAVTAEMRASERAANAACQARYPDVVPYISTRATVRDLDALRAAVGDAKLTFWGTSYGTRIGYVYAHDYPDRVRAMLLTSSVDPNATWGSFALGGAVAPDTALGFAFEGFPGTTTRYLRSRAALDARTIALPSGTQFTRWMLDGTLSLQATSESNYAGIAAYVRNADDALFATGATQSAAVRALDEATVPWTKAPVTGGATPFIGCADYAQRLTAAEQDALHARIRAQAPITGWTGAQGLFYCEGMTFAPDPVPVDFTDWTTPILIMGSTRDALTPYGWTADMARTFRNSRVVTRVGGQHTPFLSGSSCVDAYGIAYLVGLKRPKVDVTCPSAVVGGAG